MDDNSIENNVFMARLAEQAERYQEMVQYMRKVATTPKNGEDGVHLTLEERNLLSVAYKNVVGSRRASWRVLSSLEQKEEAKGSEERAAKIKQFRQVVEKELNEICRDVLGVLKDTLIPASVTVEEKVFYLKMAGDYYRYLAEFLQGADGQSVISEAKKAYEDAMKEATQGKTPLAPTSPILLGLALNFSVFYYEILNGPSEACQLAKKAFDQAVAELDTLSEEDYKDATLILQLLRDNLTLWTSDADDNEPPAENDLEVTEP